jgi:RNA polymerase sigma-70 factor, ECF subfamily
MGAVEPSLAKRFSEIYERFYGQVYGYAQRRVGRETADEIAAETFLVAWRRLEAMPSEPLPWLYGVARNVILRHHATDARERAARLALEREPGLPEPAEDDDPDLWAAWRQLRPADREVLALVAWEELSVAEAARSLSCSAPVFSVRLHRARKRFERLLQHPGRAPRAVSNLSKEPS